MLTPYNFSAGRLVYQPWSTIIMVLAPFTNTMVGHGRPWLAMEPFNKLWSTMVVRMTIEYHGIPWSSDHPFRLGIYRLSFTKKYLLLYILASQIILSADHRPKDNKAELIVLIIPECMYTHKVCDHPNREFISLMGMAL